MGYFKRYIKSKLKIVINLNFINNFFKRDEEGYIYFNELLYETMKNHIKI